MDLLLASNNKHKIYEIKEKFKEFNLDFNVLSISDISSENIEIEETESTLEGNAKLKSRFICNKFKYLTIADDTGLEVEALNNAPGVYSARFSGIHGNDALNRRKLLDLLQNQTNRNARFRTIICVSDKYNDFIIEGICKGVISNYEIGENGFGYDSIFIPNGYDKTFAELEIKIKNKISHRAIAVSKLVEFLKNYSI